MNVYRTQAADCRTRRDKGMCEFVSIGEDQVIERNMALAERKDYTVEDLEKLPEDVRAELIDGQMFLFASPRTTHQRLILALGTTLKQHIDEKGGSCETLLAPLDVRLNQDNRTQVQPDVMVVCDPDKVHEEGIWGAPDLIIEIVSKSTKRRDYGLKLLKYRTAGVREYWVVDPFKRTVMVCWFEDETENDCYGFDEPISFHIFPELAVRIQDLLP